jgi:hypothetical protein
LITFLDKLKSDEKLFKDFYDGIISRKKEGFKDIKEESNYLFGQLKDYSQEPNQPILW